MTLQQMYYLITIADNHSMNKAADKLFIAQPTITSAVRDAEKEIGMQIFHRTHKGVIPTSEGKVFLDKIKKVIQQYEEIMETYDDKKKYRRKFAVSMQHYSFAVKAFIEMAKHYDSNQFDLALRETTTAKVINDVSSLKSEIGILYICETNQRVMNRLFRENELEFNSLIECPASVYLARSHPLANKEKLTFEELAPYPCMSFEQGSETEIFFAEELLTEHIYQKTVKATDRATMMNLIEGLNGYTLCSNIYSEKLSGDQFFVIPFKTGGNTQNMMNIGFITKKNFELSHMGKDFLNEVKHELEIRE